MVDDGFGIDFGISGAKCGVGLPKSKKNAMQHPKTL